MVMVCDRSPLILILAVAECIVLIRCIKSLLKPILPMTRYKNYQPTESNAFSVSRLMSNTVLVPLKIIYLVVDSKRIFDLILSSLRSDMHRPSKTLQTFRRRPPLITERNCCSIVSITLSDVTTFFSMPSCINFWPRFCIDDRRVELFRQPFPFTPKTFNGVKVKTLWWPIHVWKWLLVLPDTHVSSRSTLLQIELDESWPCRPVFFDFRRSLPLQRKIEKIYRRKSLLLAITLLNNYCWGKAAASCQYNEI